MPQEKLIWEAVVFGTVLLVALGAVMISFIFIYQRKKYLHQQEVVKMQETFTQEILHSKNEIQEQTLQHIATEIHDNFNPTLSVINLNLAEVIPKVETPAKDTIIDTKVLVKQLMSEMRVLSTSLNTDQISQIGFARSLEKHVDHLRKSRIYDIAFNKTGSEYRLPANKEIILLRMCQEIINNIVKHANARNISIQLIYDPRLYKVEIKDDGRGFDPAAVSIDPEKQDSTGLRNLRNRAEALKALLTINSQPGSGTTITIQLPL